MSVNLERRVNRRDFLCALGLVGALSTRKSFSNPTNQKVIVIGAGAAGLAATGALLDAGVPTVCIEAGNRIGGRVYTDFNHFGVPYDIGAHWIHLAPIGCIWWALYGSIWAIWALLVSFGSYLVSLGPYWAHLGSLVGWDYNACFRVEVVLRA